MEHSTYALDIGGKNSINFVLNCIEKHLEINSYKNIKVLDIGCGTGQLTQIIARRYDFEIVGIDIDSKSLDVAKESLKDFPNTRLFLSSIENFTTQETFDLIIMTQVLDHINNPVEVLEKCRKLTNDTGQVIIGISNGYGLYELSKKFFPNFMRSVLKRSDKLNKLKETPYTFNHDSPHLHHFSIKNIRKILSKANLTILETKKMTFILPAFPFCLLYYFTPDLIANIFELLDYTIASILPASCSSNWYISCANKW